MIRLSSPWLIISIAGAAVVAVLAADPRGSKSAAGPDQFDDLPELASIRSELNAQQDIVLARMHYKEQLIRGLIEGDFSLDLVTDEFLRVNEESPSLSGIIRSRYPGSGDEEKTARNVIAYVRGRAPKGEAGAEVMARLEEQFQARFGHSPRRN